MSREATISQEQVNATADSIRATGAKPTARAIREALGGGSMATVLKFLQVWQGGQTRPAEAPVVLPAALQRALVDFLNQEVSTAKAELQSELVSAQQANSDLIKESERQAETIETQAETIESIQVEKARLTGRLNEVESYLVKANELTDAERTAAELARTEVAKAQLRLEALPRIQIEIDRLRIELDQERAGRTTAEQSAAVAIARLEAMTDRAEKANADLDNAGMHLARTTVELNTARVQVQAQQTTLDSLARECADLKEQTTEARANAKKSGELAAELRGQLTATKTKPTKPNPAAKG